MSVVNSEFEEQVPEGYQRTEVGVIPNDWSVNTIGNLTSDVGDGIHATPVYSSAGEYYFVNGNNIVSGCIKVTDDTKRVDEKEFEKHKKNLSKRTILLSINGTIGNLGFYNDEPLVLGKSAAYMNVKEHHSLEYIYYCLQAKSTKDFFADGLTGSTIKNLGIGVIRATPVPMPTGKKEQTAIANALSDVDALITSLKKLIAKKRAIKTAAMQQLLTGKKRLPPFDTLATTGGKPAYKQTELGEIPVDWEVKNYGQVFRFLTTASNSRSDLHDSGNYQYIHYGDIHVKWDTIVDFSIEQIPKIDSNKVKNANLLKDGDLIMADASEDYDGIGKSVEVAGLDDLLAVSGLHTFLLRDTGVFVDGYRGFLHKIISTKHSFDRLATGLKVYGLSKGKLKDVLLSVPPKAEQLLIVSMLSDMSSEISVLSARLNKTQQLKQGMMQELLTGRTRLV